MSDALHRAEMPRCSAQYDQLAPLADDTLMAHLRNGDPDALAVLFDRYHRLVLNIALRILRDSGEAEDVMQSVFLEIFRCADQFDADKGTAKVWILQYAYHRSFNRRQYLNLRGIYERPDETPARHSNGHHDRSSHVLESARIVQQALGRLSKPHRRTLELAFYEGLTMREISARTGESFDSVRHQYYRGLEKLRSMLRDAPASRRETPSAGEDVAHVQP